MKKFLTTMRTGVSGVLVLAAALAVTPTLAFADDAPTLDADVKAAAASDKKTYEDGFTKKLTVGGTGTTQSTSSWVGAVDGTTIQIGVLVTGETSLVRSRHEWKNELKLQHAQTRTPLLDSFVKSSDNLEFQSTWMYHPVSIDWLGPFARVRLQTQIFSGYDVRTDAGTVERTALGGAVTTEPTTAQQRVVTTSPFEPALLKETAGAFANPIEGKFLNLTAVVGVGAQSLFAQDGWAVTGYDKDNHVTKLKQLETAHEVGAEVEVKAGGELSDTVKWSAKAGWFMPAYSTSSSKQSGIDALNTDLTAGISVKLAKWASLDYVVNLKRIPLVLDDWQLQHGMLLTAGFNIL